MTDITGIDPAFIDKRENPVKRMIYISRELDDQLKRTAKLERRKITEQVRVLLEKGLEELYQFEVKNG